MGRRIDCAKTVSDNYVWMLHDESTGHICFWFDQDNALFCGNTLFTRGWGRLGLADAPPKVVVAGLLRSLKDSYRPRQCWPMTLIEKWKPAWVESYCETDDLRAVDMLRAFPLMPIAGL